MPLQKNNIINKLKKDSLMTFNKLNDNLQLEVFGTTSAPVIDMQELSLFAFESKLYNTILTLTDDIMKIWAYKMYWDYALIIQGLASGFVGSISSDVRFQTIGSIGGAITVGQMTNIWKYASKLLLSNKEQTYRTNTLPMILYGIESSVMYFWLNLLSGYSRINVQSDDDLIKGATYIYNNSPVRSLNQIKKAFETHISQKDHVELIQIKYNSTHEGEHISTKDPYLMGYRGKSGASVPVNPIRLRSCLFPQGTSIRFKNKMPGSEWLDGLVVDDLGNIWKNKEKNYDIELMNGFHETDIKQSRGNRRTILYFRLNEDNQLEINSSIVNVSHEYMGQEYRSHINIQIIYGILAWCLNSGEEYLTIISILLNILSGYFISNQTLTQIWAPVITTGIISQTSGITDGTIILNTSMIASYLINNITNMYSIVPHSISDRQKICIIVEIDIDIGKKNDQGTMVKYIKNGIFWNVTSATTLYITDIFSSSILLENTNNERYTELQKHPHIYDDDNNTYIKFIHRSGNGLEEILFKRPKYMGNGRENNKKLEVYHPWYYYIF